VAAEQDAQQRGALRAAGIQDQDYINDHLNTGLNFVVQELLPRQVLARAKRDLRRFSRKPAEMKVPSYYQAVGRINDEELPQLPPFGADQSLSNDEVLDILLHGTLKSWQVEMDRQGFDPLDKQIPEVANVGGLRRTVWSQCATIFGDNQQQVASSHNLYKIHYQQCLCVAFQQFR
jgi:hypothetical protein